MKSKKRNGLTVAEVMVASAMFVLLMIVGLGALQVIKRTGDHLKGRSVPRQQLRALFTHLQHDVRAATFVYDVNQTVDFGGGFSHNFLGGPQADPSLPPANALLFAIPESGDSAPTYTVQGLFLQEDTSTDRAYDNAFRVISASVGNLTGATPGSPADIPLGSLPTSDSAIKTFQTASPGDGLKVRLSTSLDGLEFAFVIGHKTEGESVQFETYTTHLTMRNNR